MGNTKINVQGQSRSFLVTSFALITVLTATRMLDPAKAYADTNSYEWSKVVDQNLYGGNYSAVASSSDGSHLITAVTNGSPNANPLYVSDNYGATWQDVSASVDPGMSDYWQDVAVSDNGETMVAVSNEEEDLSNSNINNGQIFISHDGGSSWQNITPNTGTQWEYVAISGDGTKIAALTGDDNSDVYVSNDGGSSWTTSPTTAPVNSWWSLSMSDNGDKILVGGENQNNLDSLLDISDDGGSSWTDITPDDESIVASVFNSTATLSRNGNEIAAGSYGYSSVTYNVYDAVYVSSDDGSDWTNDTPDQSNSDVWSAIALSNAGALIVGNDNDNTMFDSNDYGTDWSEEDPNLADQSSNNWTSIALSTDGSHAIAASSANVYVGPDPSLIPASISTNQTSDPSVTTTTSSSTSTNSPDTGYGTPTSNTKANIVATASIVAVAAGTLIRPISRRIATKK
jgi:photosystem II stability/assembly factor-like uncharacterized protein